MLVVHFHLNIVPEFWSCIVPSNVYRWLRQNHGNEIIVLASLSLKFLPLAVKHRILRVVRDFSSSRACFLSIASFSSTGLIRTITGLVDDQIRRLVALLWGVYRFPASRIFLASRNTCFGLQGDLRCCIKRCSLSVKLCSVLLKVFQNTWKHITVSSIVDDLFVKHSRSEKVSFDILMVLSPITTMNDRNVWLSSCLWTENL